MTALTPLYGIKYIQNGEPIRNTRQALEDNAFTIEAALAGRAIPPADIAALVAAGWFSDTGWVAIVPNTGFTAAENLAYRVRAGIVYLRGVVIRTAGNFPASATAVFTLPAGARTASFLRFPAPAGMSVNVNTTGVVEAFADPTAVDRVRVANIQFVIG